MAISGAVKTLDDTVFRSSGATASPRKCHIAIRPCMAATEASMRTPVQSPAAYTPSGGGARDAVDLDEAAVVEGDPGLLQPEPGGAGHRAEREQAVRALDLAAVLEA